MTTNSFAAQMLAAGFSREHTMEALGNLVEVLRPTREGTPGVALLTEAEAQTFLAETRRAVLAR